VKKIDKLEKNSGDVICAKEIFNTIWNNRQTATVFTPFGMENNSMVIIVIIIEPNNRYTNLERQGGIWKEH
jgi:hypothetical protein